MDTGNGLITKIFNWIWHPSNSSETLTDWGAGLVVVLIASFLWATVVHQIE